MVAAAAGNLAEQQGASNEQTRAWPGVLCSDCHGVDGTSKNVPAAVGQI